MHPPRKFEPSDLPFVCGDQHQIGVGGVDRALAGKLEVDRHPRSDRGLYLADAQSGCVRSRTSAPGAKSLDIHQPRTQHPVVARALHGRD